jgi:signal transduction histidine kinase
MSQQVGNRILRIHPQPSGGMVTTASDLASPLDAASDLASSAGATTARLRLASLLGLVPDTVLRIRSDGTILEYHPSQDSELSLSVSQVQGARLQDLLPGRYAEEAMHLISQALLKDAVQSHTAEIPVNSLVRELEARVLPCGPDEVMVLVRDVTDRQRLEKEILEISHREQQRIGQDLHDSLGQHLTGISFLSKALQTKLTSRNLAEAAQAGEIAQLVVQTLAHTRNIARGLFPVELETTGRLAPALTELIANTEKLFRVTCRLELDPALDIADVRISTELFRIAQEAISNAIKHGKARRICVRLQASPPHAKLLIQDDGGGIAAGTGSTGLGLRIMGFRANRIGGRIDVSPLDIGGTLVTCEFPFPGAAADASRMELKPV